MSLTYKDYKSSSKSFNLEPLQEQWTRKVYVCSDPDVKLSTSPRQRQSNMSAGRGFKRTLGVERLRPLAYARSKIKSEHTHYARFINEALDTQFSIFGETMPLNLAWYSSDCDDRCCVWLFSIFSLRWDCRRPVAKRCVHQVAIAPGLPCTPRSCAQRHQAREHLNLWQGVSQGQAVRLRHDAARRLAGEACERHHPVHGARALWHVQARGLLRGLQHRRVGLRSAALLHADGELPLGEGHALRHFLRGVCALAEAADRRGAVTVAADSRTKPCACSESSWLWSRSAAAPSRRYLCIWPPLDAGWPGGR